jgi:lipopolysaccharide export system permease protein
MSRLNFFPSPTLAWYVAKMFIIRSAAILAMLVVVLMTLDLLGESGKILAVPGNGDAEIWRYIGFRLPQIIARFLPFSVLLGTLLTLATLNQNSEVVSMKSAGMSAHQILAPLVLTSLAIAGISFAFNERLVTRANATLSAWQKVDYAVVPPNSGVRSNVWARSGDILVGVRLVHRTERPLRLEGVTIFDRERGGIRRVIEAEAALRTADGWTLTAARGFDVTNDTPLPTIDGTIIRDFAPDRFTLANVRGDELSFGELRSAIADLRAAGRSTDALEASLWHKISGPLSSILMPLLGAVAAFGLARSGQLFVRAVIGMALGFAYFVVDNFAMSMGNLGAYDALLAAWAPFVLFLLIGETVLIRTEE